MHDLDLENWHVFMILENDPDSADAKRTRESAVAGRDGQHDSEQKRGSMSSTLENDNHFREILDKEPYWCGFGDSRRKRFTSNRSAHIR